jgi:FMN phosphatase YigB (HAD superfamily)
MNKRPRSIRAVVFDFHGVLSVDQYWQKTKASVFSCVQSSVFVETNSFVQDWMRGRITSEQVCSLLATKLNLDYKEVLTALVESCGTFHLQPRVLQRIKRLRATMPVFLVTTNMDCFTRYVIPQTDIEGEFDRIVSSSELGLLKEDNNGEIFERLANDVSIPVSEMCLLDDSPNIGNIFESLGGNYIHVEKGPLRESDFALIEARLNGDTTVKKIVCGTALSRSCSSGTEESTASGRVKRRF